MKLQIILQILTLFGIFSPAIGQKDYIVSYWPLIYKAESAIVENDQSRALAIYRAAFQSVDRVFAIDLANAAVCAIKVDSLSIAFELLHRLILKGISKSYLQEFMGFEKLRADQQWRKFLSSYDSLRTSVQFNDRLRIQLDSLAEIDQKFRIASGSYLLYSDTISKIDQSNIQYLKKVIEKFGFPNEHALGVEDPRINFPGEILLHHHCQSMSLDSSGTKYNFEHDFYEAIQLGELDPHRMAQLVAMQGQYAPELGQNTVKQLSLNSSKSGPLRIRVNPDRNFIIDENRFKAGLESQFEYYRKAVFALFDPRAKDYEFKRYLQTEIYECNELTYNTLLNNFEPINIR